MQKKYTNGDVTVVWKPDVCIHAGNCARGLPSVFDPKAKPWVNMEGASSDEIRAQVAKCPSGALSMEESSQAAVESASHSSVQVNAGGPLRVQGPCEVTHADGRTEMRDKDVFLCRCGHSSNKPYCDGAHKREGFQD